MIRQQIRNESRVNKELKACDHLKRGHQPEEADDAPRSPKKSKVSNAIASIRKRLSSLALSNTEHDSLLHVQQELGAYTPELQTSHDLYHHELELIPKQTCYSDYHPMSQTYNPAITTHQKQQSNKDIDGAGPNEIDLDTKFTSIARIYSSKTAYSRNEGMIMKDLDAVYDSIVLDNKGPAHGSLSRIPSNQSYFFFTPDCSTSLHNKGWGSHLAPQEGCDSPYCSAGRTG